MNPSLMICPRRVTVREAAWPEASRPMAKRLAKAVFERELSEGMEEGRTHLDQYTA